MILQTNPSEGINLVIPLIHIREIAFNDERELKMKKNNNFLKTREQDKFLYNVRSQVNPLSKIK